MKKRILCCILAAILLAMTIPTFAYRNSSFSANSIYRAYTFKNFLKPTSATRVYVSASKIDYHDDGAKNYFYACPFDDDANAMTSRGYMKVIEDTFAIDYPIYSSYSSTNYFNLKVYNAYYYKDKDQNYKMSIEAFAEAK